MDALLRAVRRGVTCRVLIDALGSHHWARRVVERLSAGGAEIRLALPFGFRRRSARADLRNHRKIAVIDGYIGYTGSQNIVDADFRPGIVNQELVVRVTGPIVLELQAVFVADWYLETEQALAGPDLFPELSASGEVAAQVLPSGPDYPAAGIEHLIVALVHGARRRVAVTTPYFVPDEPLLQALQTAAMRGVEVHLVVSGIADHPLVNLAQRSYYAELLQSGVRIHLFQDKLLHAKHLSVDGEVALIGSSNVDIRSFVLNAEVSLITYNRDVVARLRAEQERNFAASVQLSLAAWAGRSPVGKFGENLARLLSPLL
jgi:cardiolipin synthase